MKQSSSLLGGGINRFEHEVDEKERHLEKDREDGKMDFSFSRRLLFQSSFFDWVYSLSKPWEKITKQNYQNIHILIFKKEEYTCSSLESKFGLWWRFPGPPLLGQEKWLGTACQCGEETRSGLGWTQFLMACSQETNTCAQMSVVERKVRSFWSHTRWVSHPIEESG